MLRRHRTKRGQSWRCHSTQATRHSAARQSVQLSDGQAALLRTAVRFTIPNTRFSARCGADPPWRESRRAATCSRRLLKRTARIGLLLSSSGAAWPGAHECFPVQLLLTRNACNGRCWRITHFDAAMQPTHPRALRHERAAIAGHSAIGRVSGRCGPRARSQSRINAATAAQLAGPRKRREKKMGRLTTKRSRQGELPSGARVPLLDFRPA